MNAYGIAGLRIGIESVYEDVRKMCGEYRIDDVQRDFDIKTGPEDIAFEREKSRMEDEREGIPVRKFSDCYLETLAVYRKISEKAPFYDTILFHGSCIAVDGQGYLFTAKSGTGKSTHARLWRELLGERAVMVNDDKPMIRLTKDGPVIYGTPWNGKHRLGCNMAVPLKAVCILNRGTENRIEEAKPGNVFPLLLQQTYRPADREAMVRTLSLLDGLSRRVELWQLWCNMDPSAARLSYRAMSGDQAGDGILP